VQHLDGVDRFTDAHAQRFALPVGQAQVEAGVAGLQPQRGFARADGAPQRQRPMGIFGAQAHFDGVAAEADVGLRQRQRLAARHAQLPLDQVEPGDGLGHRVLHLQAGVHLHEEEVAAGVEQEFHRAGAFIARRLHQP
jgi:hypothetical protein